MKPNENNGKDRRDRRDDPMLDETRIIRDTDNDRNAGKDRPHRTQEERERIDEMIADYQHHKLVKRIVIISVALLLVAAAIIAWKVIVRPPDIVKPTPSAATANKPSVTYIGTYAPTSSADTGAAAQKPTARQDGVYTFIVLGMDKAASLTDTIIIGKFDTVNQKLNLVSVPRDTFLNVDRSYKKANGMYSHNGFDIEAVKDELQQLLGFRIDNYVVVDIVAFQKIVDAIGGVDFDVPINMDYDDEIQDFSIHLMAGYQHLDGYGALGVVRFRQNNSWSPYGPGYIGADIDRIATQQAFMKTVVKQLLTIGTVTKINELAKIFEEYVDTDLSLGNMVWYGKELVKVKSENVTFSTLPADYNDYAFDMAGCVIKLDDWVTMINDKLNPYSRKITEDDIDIITRDKNGKLYATSGKIKHD